MKYSLWDRFKTVKDVMRKLMEMVMSELTLKAGREKTHFATETLICLNSLPTNFYFFSAKLTSFSTFKYHISKALIHMHTLTFWGLVSTQEIHHTLSWFLIEIKNTATNKT